MVEQQKQLRLKLEMVTKYGLLLQIILLFFVSSSFSQEKTVRLDSVATDVQGNPVRNVTVIATNRKTNYRSKTVTDEKGHFTFRNMPPGNYSFLFVGQGIRDDLIVDATILLGYDYLLRVKGQKGELLSFIHEGKIKFVVTDPKGKLIPNTCIKFTKGSLKRAEDRNAKLVSWDEKNECFPITDSDESVIFSFDPKYPIGFEIKALGFKSQQKSLELKPDDSITLTFRLKKN